MRGHKKTHSPKPSEGISANQVILRSRRAIPVRPEVVRLLGHDFIAAVYLEQLLYYNAREQRYRVGGEDGYFPKSKTEIETDTALTRYQQDRARSKLIEAGFLKVKVSSAGAWPIMFFKLKKTIVKPE